MPILFEVRGPSVCFQILGEVVPYQLPAGSSPGPVKFETSPRIDRTAPAASLASPLVLFLSVDPGQTPAPHTTAGNVGTSDT